MNFDKVFTVKKEISKEEFLRKVLVTLASSGDTPVDVVKAQFGDVNERVREVIVCSAHVETDYSASIGYDRQEEYWDKEKKTEYVNGQRHEYYVDVKKTRTVTDWQPHSGHTSGDSVSAAFNEEDSWKQNNSSMIQAIRTVKDENIVEKGSAVVSASGLDEAKTRCGWDIHFSISFPGDHHKDERYNDDVTVKTLECYKLPFYEVEFSYGGKKYHASGFACGEINVETEFPENNVNIVYKASQDTAGARKGMKIGWIAFGALFAFAIIMDIVGVYWTWAFTLVALVLAIVLHVRSDKKFKARLRELKEDNVKIKRSELDSALKKYGYAPVTKDEAEKFNAEKVSEDFAYDNKRKGPKVPAILCSIATVILAITSCVVGAKAKSNKLHSPEQFTIQITNMSHEYKSNVSPYVNGCYYVYFDYKVTAKDIGADYMAVKTTVFKNGSNLGYITTNLNNMNLDAGSTKTYKCTLQDNQPEINHNTFFITLYNGSLSDFTFTHEITSINFPDGNYYYAN